ncbi:hypothetical protein RQP46_000397 [Phenoliferia psychrophenolica]
MSTQDCVDCLPTEPSSAPAPLATKEPSVDPVLDPNTFVPPVLNEDDPSQELPRVVIEFCDRCRWLHRATWTLTELFLTFPPTTTLSPEGVPSSSGLKAITLLPRSDPETGGRFRVWLYRHRSIEDEFEQSEGKDAWRGAELVWDRKVEGTFPEMKVLSELSFSLSGLDSLGHSDKDAFKKKDGGAVAAAKEEDAVPVEPTEPEPTVDDYAPRFKC